jgi:hypothetical protein
VGPPDPYSTCVFGVCPMFTWNPCFVESGRRDRDCGLACFAVALCVPKMPRWQIGWLCL